MAAMKCDALRPLMAETRVDGPRLNDCSRIADAQAIPMGEHVHLQSRDIVKSCDEAGVSQFECVSGRGASVAAATTATKEL